MSLDHATAQTLLDQLRDWMRESPMERRQAAAVLIDNIRCAAFGDKAAETLKFNAIEQGATLPALISRMAWLRQLCFLDCASLCTLDGVLPSSLESLSLSNCPSLSRLPALPVSLRRLWINNCASLRELPALLPAHLADLEISSCASLWRLSPALPPGLRVLHVRDCRKLDELPALPADLRTIDLQGCVLLQASAQALVRGFPGGSGLPPARHQVRDEWNDDGAPPFVVGWRLELPELMAGE